MPQFGRARCAGRGGHRSSETTEIYQCKRAVVRSCGPSGAIERRCRMHRSCGSATTQFPFNFRNTIHALAPRHRRLARRLGLARARPPSAANAAPSPPSRRETAAPRGSQSHRADSPACVIGRALRVDMKNDGEAVAPRDRSTGGRDGPRRMVRMARYQTPRRARGPDPPARQRPNNALRYSETASANTDLPRHGQPSGGPAHPRDPRATRMHAVLPRPLLSTRVLVLLPPNLPNLA